MPTSPSGFMDIPLQEMQVIHFDWTELSSSSALYRYSMTSSRWPDQYWSKLSSSSNWCASHSCRWVWKRQSNDIIQSGMLNADLWLTIQHVWYPDLDDHHTLISLATMQCNNHDSHHMRKGWRKRESGDITSRGVLVVDHYVPTNLNFGPWRWIIRE